MEENKPNPLVSKIEIKATVPCMQYGNLIPSIEFSNVPMRDGMEIGLEYIKEIFAKYSEKGALPEKSVTTTLKSFNEGVEVSFDALNHVYTYKGTSLTSATTFIKKFYKEFNAEAIAGASAKAWGVDEAELRSLWKSNGSLTSDMGTVIHGALEHYDKFKKLGKTVKDKKELAENYALPKHPLLQAIIKEFIEIDKVEGETMNEILLTDIENGVCGQMDRMKVTGEKTCRVQDFKINIDSDKVEKGLKASEPWSELPANKISKNQLQLSIYANMLQKSGWTVTGLDLFVYEATWKHFELPVLQVLPVKNA